MCIPPKLYISSLPSLHELARFHHVTHVQHWINVSGIDINQIYPIPALSAYSISQFNFADVFTDGKKIINFSELESITIETYQSASELTQRHAFLAAIKALITQFENQIPTGIFCHRGLARSPLVAVAAINYIHKESLFQSIARVQKLHPPAYFTDVSISALLWCKEQLQDSIIIE